MNAAELQINDCEAVLKTKPFAVRTRDGWDVVLHRIEGSGEAPPVLLLPGYGTDHRCYLPPEHPGVATALRAAGRDVWMLDFRGSGASRPATGEAGAISLDARVAHDIPAALQAICEVTGAKSADVVGHSMGGVMMYVHLAIATEPMVRRLVTLASPASFRPSGPGGIRELALAAAGRLARRVPRVPTKRLFQVITHLPLERPYRSYFDPSNVPSRMVRRYVREMSTDLFGHELAQLADWFGTGRLSDMERREDRRLHLERITVPALFLAGSADKVVSERGVALAYESFGSAEKRFLTVGRSHGGSAEYGHLDLLAGTWAPVDVFPRIVSWLAVGAGQAQ